MHAISPLTLGNFKRNSNLHEMALYLHRVFR
jgi:hypothetical protein